MIFLEMTLGNDKIYDIIKKKKKHVFLNILWRLFLITKIYYSQVISVNDLGLL